MTAFFQLLNVRIVRKGIVSKLQLSHSTFDFNSYLNSNFIIDALILYFSCFIHVGLDFNQNLDFLMPIL